MALVIAASLALIGGVAACGGDDETTDASADTTRPRRSTESAEDVTVTATEYEFDTSATPTEETDERLVR